MGFHKPERNSQYHLHLHLVVWPLKDPERHERAYGEGKGLVTVQSVYEIFNQGGWDVYSKKNGAVKEVKEETKQAAS